MSLFTTPGPQRTGSLFDGRTRVRNDGPVYVIGAVNMDLSGTPSAPLRTGDSNPGTVRSLAGYRRVGVNRLSLGVQAAQDRLLWSIGRIHIRREAEDAEKPENT